MNLSTRHNLTLFSGGRERDEPPELPQLRKPTSPYSPVFDVLFSLDGNKEAEQVVNKIRNKVMQDEGLIHQAITMMLDKDLLFEELPKQAATVFAADILRDDRAKPYLVSSMKDITYVALNIDDEWQANSYTPLLEFHIDIALDHMEDYLYNPNSETTWDQGCLRCVETMGNISKREGLVDIKKRIIQILMNLLKDPLALNPTYNGFIVCSLVELKAKEANDVVREAYRLNCVDLGINGGKENSSKILHIFYS